MSKKLIGIIILAAIIIVGVVVYISQSKGSGGGFSGQYQAKPTPASITGVSGYNISTVKIDGKDIPLIKVPLVTWGGYAALFAANKGIKPNKNSLFYKNGGFVVELVQEENPITQLQEYAKGNYPIIWSTMDMLPLMYDVLKQDKRVIPQVFGIFDWSFGGDGIIVRGNIKTPKDLKGKRIVTAGHTPSHYFLLWLLAQSDIQPADVQIVYVDDAIQAKDAFIKDKNIDACVTWSPFIYDITDPKNRSYVDGSRLLITSKDANQLIADCYLTRLDFAKEHPEMVEAFSKSMMEGFQEYTANPGPVYQWIADLFKLPGGASDAKLMIGDVHIANFPENLMFFDISNPISAYKVFFLSHEYYKMIGSLPQDSSYDAETVINSSFLQKFKSQNLFASQQNTIKNSFNRQSSFNIADLESKKVVLAQDIEIYFDAQSVDFDFTSSREEIANNKKLLSKVAQQMDVLGTTIVKLVGHLDTTKVADFKAMGAQAFIEASAQAKLISKRRAEFIKTILVEKYGCDPQRIITEGKGWDQPIDSTDQTKNRRVEVRFLSFE